MNKLYKVGIYCRLSVDDASNSAKARNYVPADESVSIENQRELLSKFAMLNGWVETKTYCDDGYSGGNFQRPGFLEMLEDARNGVINLILVKDLSRLRRDFVEVGRYTEHTFPAGNLAAPAVKFICLIGTLAAHKNRLLSAPRGTIGQLRHSAADCQLLQGFAKVLFPGKHTGYTVDRASDTDLLV